MNTNDRTPLYYQLMNELLRRMDSGEIKPGEQLPSELDLKQEYNVSRATVRKAYEELALMGRIKKKQGLGAFANHPRIEKGVSKLTGFSEDILNRGGVPTSITKSQTLETANENVRLKLKLEENGLVNKLERIRLNNNVPIATEICYIPYALCNLQDIDLNKQSVYSLLEKQYNLEITNAIQSLEPMLPTKEDKVNLELDEDELILYTERLTYLDNQTPVEYTETKYRSSKFKFWVTLKR